MTTAIEEQQVLDTIDRWVEKEVRPIARKFDQADEYPADLVEQMKELGLFGATIGQQWGGLGLSASTYARVVTRISQAWMAPTGIFNSHLIMAACVERHGTEEQKQRYLPRFATGELRGGIGLTEPNAGTDLQGIRTAARREPDATGRDVDPAELETAHGMVEAAALGATHELVGIDAEILEDELRTVDGPVTELADLSADAEPGTLLGDEHAHALVAWLRFRVGLREHGETGAVDAVRDPGLGAVDHVSVAVAASHGADAL